jgi:Phosphopantetheine attachment site
MCSITSGFVALDQLPHTPNGKLDRRALPAPSQGRPLGKTVLVAPRTLIEAALAQLWANLLGLEQVGIDDNFFALGGHFLLATQVISRVRSAFQVELPLRTLFEAPTVAGLACAVTQNQHARTDSSMSITESINRGDVERLLARLDQLSDTEADALLSDVFTQQELHE